MQGRITQKFREKLGWEWEPKLQSMNTLVFIIPGSFVKNSDERLVVLNRIAMLVQSTRSKHATHVFCNQGKPVLRMLNGAWLRARSAVGLPQVRVHDLKHTFRRRVSAAGVSFGDRQELLRARAGRNTTQYTALDLSHSSFLI